MTAVAAPPVPAATLAASPASLVAASPSSLLAAALSSLPAASPTSPLTAGTAASANQPISALAPGGPPGADPPTQPGSFSDLLATARTAPAEGQTRKAQPLPSPVSADALTALYMSGAPSAAAPTAIAAAADVPATGDAVPVGPSSAASTSSVAVASASVEQASSASSGDSAPTAPAPISPVSAVAVGGVGALPAGSHLNHLTTFGSQQGAPAPRAANQPTAATPGQSSQSDQPREDTARPAAAVTADHRDTPTGAAPTVNAEVDPAAHAKVDPAAHAKGACADTAASATADVKRDQAGSASPVGNGTDMPIAPADVTQPHAGDSAPGISAPTAAVPLHQSAEALNATLTTMTKQGLTQARINLTPESLGGVKVVLTQTDNGLVARVIADHPEAAQALAAGAGELRRSLEANGTTLVSLEFGTGDGRGAGDSSNQNGAAPYTSPSAAGAANGYAPLGDPTDDETTQTRQLTVALGDGSLVNVLA